MADSYSELVGNDASFSGFGFDYFVQKKVDRMRPFVLDHIGRKSQGRASLDIGASKGQHAAGVEELGFSATLTDVSPQFLEVPRKKGGIQPWKPPRVTTRSFHRN